MSNRDVVTDPRSTDRRLVEAVERATPRLMAMSDADSAHRPGPGKWSPREVIGHLIDSASNNHQRFVRAQFQGDLIFPGYEQDAWVSAQQYQDAPWHDLVTLWQTFNLHLARVIAAVPRDIRSRVQTRHNLDTLAFQKVASGAPVTLEYFMADYVDHLRHHLRQIGVDE